MNFINVWILYLVKLKQEMIAAKNTMTMKFYRELQQEFNLENEIDLNQSFEESKQKELSGQPISNIFKMSRVPITYIEKDKSKKKEKQLEDTDERGRESQNSDFGESSSSVDSDETFMNNLDGNQKKQKKP